MSPRSDDPRARAGRAGFAGFMRSLLAGIPWHERAEDEAQWSFEAPSGGVLRLHNANGHTRVHGEDRDDVQVVACRCARAESAEAARRLLEAIHVGSNEVGDALELEVEIPRKWNRRGQANLAVRVPRGLRVEVSASNGRIEVEGIRGPVSARSSNGSATITDVTGGIQVATSNAKVSCTQTRGRLVARSSNGKISIEGHRGSVDASTSNGLISASLEEVGKGGVLLATSNGRIALKLPAVVDADVDIRVDNGLIRNDRRLETAVRESNGRVRGRLGAGGPLIKLRTSNGSISLR